MLALLKYSSIRKEDPAQTITATEYGKYSDVDANDAGKLLLLLICMLIMAQLEQQRWHLYLHTR
ncbi:hypothetical protein OH492_29195 [Vibrio chagasii]|nr:hypothetical protein [Vibrio chagasii]